MTKINKYHAKRNKTEKQNTNIIKKGKQTAIITI